MEKRYFGRPERTPRGGFVVEVVTSSKRMRPLNPRTDLYNHSPDGFAWGYGGSGPAQLALALAADVLGDDDRAVRIHHALKDYLVARWPRDHCWDLPASAIRGIIVQLEQERGDLRGPSDEGTGASNADATIVPREGGEPG